VVTGDDNSNTGSYTQIVWPETTKVGMAKAVDAKGGTYVVARYFPAGNIVGKSAWGSSKKSPEGTNHGQVRNTTRQNRKQVLTPKARAKSARILEPNRERGRTLGTRREVIKAQRASRIVLVRCPKDLVIEESFTRVSLDVQVF
jgi:hypothetical protein